MDNYKPPRPVYINRFTEPEPEQPQVSLDNNDVFTSRSSGRGAGCGQESISRGRNATSGTHGGGRGSGSGPLKPQHSHVLVDNNDTNIEFGNRAGGRGQESRSHGRNTSSNMRGEGHGSSSRRGGRGGEGNREREKGGIRGRGLNPLESRATKSRGRGEGGRNSQQAHGRGFHLLTRGGDVRPISFVHKDPLRSKPTITQYTSAPPSSQYQKITHRPRGKLHASSRQMGSRTWTGRGFGESGDRESELGRRRTREGRVRSGSAYGDDTPLVRSTMNVESRKEEE